MAAEQSDNQKYASGWKYTIPLVKDIESEPDQTSSSLTANLQEIQGTEKHINETTGMQLTKSK